MSMSQDPETQVSLIDRREAVKRVSFMLGGIALVGGSGLLTACSKDRAPAADSAAAGANIGSFTSEHVALLDEVADTILPTTARSPGAKAAKTGAFIAL
ncbi:MAG TPA: gluconate 2-dehydrogenase subunit 3 family protein, partial [Gemmatimonadaceae bacterium]|nr:gluconate 2-dehydrogenase subunit 3 family protein [Gemmatimonadaceae bacterium]